MNHCGEKGQFMIHKTKARCNIGLGPGGVSVEFFT